MSGMNEMTGTAPLDGKIETDALRVAWAEVPWDTAVFGYPVMQISDIELRGEAALVDIEPFLKSRDDSRCGLASCRLPHGRLRESMVLEEIGFRFIEMIYQPEFSNLQAAKGLDDQGLIVKLATKDDETEIVDIAGTAFRNERFHVDPRLPPGLGDLRYQNWVRSAIGHATQRLYALRDGGLLIGFFVVEYLADGTCYWHLNAIAPSMQGKGYGLRAWRTMITLARQDGCERVRTSIVARNYRVLNLYAQLGFTFPEPLMTFHWVRRA